MSNTFTVPMDRSDTPADPTARRKQNRSASVMFPIVFAGLNWSLAISSGTRFQQLTYTAMVATICAEYAGLRLTRPWASVSDWNDSIAERTGTKVNSDAMR